MDFFHACLMLRIERLFYIVATNLNSLGKSQPSPAINNHLDIETVPHSDPTFYNSNIISLTDFLMPYAANHENFIYHATDLKKSR